jgi:SAM-dependent methyltransferase
VSKGGNVPAPLRRPDEDLNAYEANLRDLHCHGHITTDDFFEAYARENARLYLSETDPRRQSGHHGDHYYWRHVRSMILEAVYHGGTFIDIGCANGYLIECLAEWMRNTGVQLDFYGLEISGELYNLAVRRRPQCASHIFLGNGLDWNPPFKFDYVYTMVLPDIPPGLRKQFLANLYNNCLESGGRLILGPSNDRAMDKEITELGFAPTGYCEKTIAGAETKIKRIVWINKH